jgi:hypothetical protein
LGLGIGRRHALDLVDLLEDPIFLLRGQRFFFGNLHLQGSDLVFQRTLLCRLGLLSLLLGLQPGVFDDL